jgi:hypothetical protein
MTREEFLEKCEGEELVIMGYDESFEEPGFYQPCKEFMKKEEFIDELFSTDNFDDDLSEIQDVSEVFEIARDIWDATRIITREEYDKERAEEKRKKLEIEAKRLAYDWGVAVNSMEFIERLEGKIDSIKDRQFGMKEDGLCIGWGVSVDQWFDEYNHLGSDINHVDEILEWINEECPLLMMKFQEQKRKEAQQQQA